jgi:phosphotransferase system enzyme I (PtsI)
VIKLSGLGVSPGIAIGRAFPIDRRVTRTPRSHVPPTEVDAEIARLRAAIARSDHQLRDIRGKLPLDAHEQGLIIEAHRLMLQDPLLVEGAIKLIRDEKTNAEWAVRRAVQKIREAFEGIRDVYFRERRADVDFVGDRIVRNLMGHSPEAEEKPPEDAILVAYDLSPADAAMYLTSRKVQGFVTDVGGATNHTSIVARALEIPAVVAAQRITEVAARYDPICIDGHEGTVVLHPSPADLMAFKAAMKRHRVVRTEQLAMRGLPARTRDGHSVELHGNIEFVEEIEGGLQHGAEGIGLYRTEFLYLNRAHPPTEEEHYRAYREVLERMAPRPVTIRTFDLGADKLPGSAGSHTRERNPALGLRAVRWCLANPEVFRTQLRAILRASAHGKARVMFPMVSGLRELRLAKQALDQAREELGLAGIAMAPRLPVGIMVEMPSAAQMADRLARECDFFSLGTNDLIQYALALDRENKDVAYLYQPLHLSVMRMIKFTADSARAHGIPVAVCGEMAGDPVLALVLVGLGVSELSMNAVSIPAVKRLIRAATLQEARQIAEEAMLHEGDDPEKAVREEVRKRFGDVVHMP